MIDVFILNKNLEIVSVVDSYNSMIWANRYNGIGDCELYLEASDQNIAYLQEGYYLARSDDSMIFQIRKIEIDTSAENGNYLIITGIDTKAFLDQRIIWNTVLCKGNVEDFIRSVVKESCINPGDRQFQKADGTQLVYLGAKAGLPEVTTEQVSYKNIGEKIREYCDTYKWGYRFILNGASLNFELYKGTDRTGSVIFSDQFENLSSTKYVYDGTNKGNVALVAGAGEGSSRTRSTFGSAQGIDRFELFVDAKDISREITWAELTESYPTTGDGGTGYIDSVGGEYLYIMGLLNTQIVDQDQLEWLQENYPGGVEVTIDGINYYQTLDTPIAVLQTDQPTDDSPAILGDIVYTVYLINRGVEEISQYGETETFDGSVIPDVTFTYKKDYFLGDLVRIENEYGIGANARIIEVVEVMDENGYSMEPTFRTEV